VEFTLFDYAIWAAGAATVTIYETSSAEQVEWIVGNSEARVIVCADDDLLKTYLERSEGVCERAISLDGRGLDELIAAGAGIDDDAVLRRAASVSQDDVATLVYTSGTTGRPKGCELTVRNLVWEIRQLVGELGDVLHEGATTLMFLPLAHIFARLVQCCSVVTGAKIAFSTGIPQLMEELAIVQPTWLFSVPRVFEKVFNSAKSKAEAEGKGRIFDIAARTAIAYSTELQAGQASLRTRLAHTVFDRLVYAKLRTALGGKLEYAVSGGAPLGTRLGHFFNGIGVLVLEGYGLTENSAVATFNRPDSVRIGTVGRPVAGSSLAIAPDGEILIKGDHVFRGYWRNPAATSEAIDADGWFHTGDVGELDADGHLTITGRKKELIVTAGGKNVAPAVLEDRLRAHPLVSQCVVVGDAKPYIAALVTLDADQATAWAVAHGKAGSFESLAADPDLTAEIQRAVDDTNQAVSKAESIRRFKILAHDFTIEASEMTPTLKVRRTIVSSHYAREIEALYE
jgi:long-chain acyl-CoA synthetase